MKIKYLSFFLFTNLCAIHAQKDLNVTYPTTKKVDQVDDYFGTKVADPYRWLEDDRSAETGEWVSAQNKLTFSYLEKIPYRNDIKMRLEKMWNYEKFGTPSKHGGKYYFFKNDGLQNQAVLYEQDKLDAPAKVILDPNNLSKEGTVALGAIAYNKPGDKLAYQVAKAGSDWQTIFVKDLITGETLKDEIHWVRFSSISWRGNGFYYARYPQPEAGTELTAKAEFQKVYYHKLGTTQADDELIYEDKQNPKRGFGVETSEDERFLCISPWEGTSGKMLIFKDLSKENSDFVTIVNHFDNNWEMIDNVGDDIFIQTNYKAPNNKIIAIDLSKPQEANWKTIIEEDKSDVLLSSGFIGNQLLAHYMHNASSRVKFFDLNGKFLKDLSLPGGGIGTLGAISGKKGEAQAFYSFSSYTVPSSIYILDMNTLVSSVFKAPKVDFDSNLYETKQIWYKSKDGVDIPMCISYKKGLKMDSKNPTLLYGYGGFNISLQPQFAITRAYLMENGFVIAVPNLRGGGEFGENWHKSGTKERKQNVFNDFIAAAEYLIANKYTSKQKLAIQGGSNGGLLVGACMTQRPDLFKVCLPAVGVMDMLRYQQFTIGRAWATDYGLSEDKTAFQYLYQYSPLHRLKKTKYPATLITTGDHDDRVVPAHSFKYAATLQENQQGKAPTLIRIETSGGHGAGKPTSKLIQENTDIFAFMMYNLGVSIKH